MIGLHSPRAEENDLTPMNAVLHHQDKARSFTTTSILTKYIENRGTCSEETLHVVRRETPVLSRVKVKSVDPVGDRYALNQGQEGRE